MHLNFQQKYFFPNYPNHIAMRKKKIKELIYWQEILNKGLLILNVFYITTKVIHTFSDHEQRNL